MERWPSHVLILRGKKKRQFGRKRTQVERHNQRDRLWPPLSLDCELSFVCFFRAGG